MSTSTTYDPQAILARWEAKQAANDSLLFNAAQFHWNGMRYQVEVRGHIVALLRTLRETREFCAMHNTERTT